VIFVASCMVGLDEGYWSLLQWPLIVGGLALMSAPMLMQSLARFEGTVPARALAWVGVISYTVLIVNEPLRSITHTMRAEGAATRWVALWVIAGLLPLTFMLARPLASVLALIPRPGVGVMRDLVVTAPGKQESP
jgi:hypothetical protein